MSTSRRTFIRNTGLAGTGILINPELKEFHLPGLNPAYAVADRLKESEALNTSGFVAERMNQTYRHRVLGQSEDELVEPFRHRTETNGWQSEFWGKWFTSAVLAYRYRPDPELMKYMQTSVMHLIATQSPDGYIGNYTTQNRLEQWDIWGMKYCLLGLLDFYQLTNQKSVLQAAGRLAGYLITEIKSRDQIIVNKGNYRGMAASSILEAMGRLYMLTGEKKYLDFCNLIVTQWETPRGPMLISKANINVRDRFPQTKNWYSWEQGQKAYEMMSCYEGLLELYRITGNELYKKAVEDTWQNIHDTEINIAGSGASAEMWFGGKEQQTTPVYHFQETCVTVTWIRFSQSLLRLTGDPKYAHAVENSFYNALLGSMNSDGSDWAKYTPLNGRRLPGTGQCGMKLNCCVANGPRALFTFPLTTVMEMKEGLSVNFFSPGSYIAKTPSGKKITLIQETDYPVTGKIRLRCLVNAPERMTLKIRIPSWSQLTILKMNGEDITGFAPGEFVELNRTWSEKDLIDLQLDMRGRLELRGTHHEYAAIKRGPVVLARDTRLKGTDLGTTITPVETPDGWIDLAPVENNPSDNLWMNFSAPFLPESYSESAADPVHLLLCDYASAGNGRETSTFQVWMPQLYEAQRKLS